jgi:hypothetical protein
MEQKANTPSETAKRFDRDPHLFIVGCARSGTTLLQRMVDAHPEIAVTPSMHWISGYLKEHKVKRPDDLVTPDLIHGLFENSRFARFQIRREELEKLSNSGASLTYSEFVSGIFDLYGKAEGKPLVGNKTAPHVRSIPDLHALWPEAKFVHIIRDGRDVCLSAINWERSSNLASRFPSWGEDPVTTAALWWEWHLRLGREAGGSLGPGLYHELRYEDLVAHPEKVCATLCAFLAVPYADAMLRFHEGRTKTKPTLSAKNAWLPVTAGLRDWRSDMPTEDVDRFEAVAGDLLEELGYERAFERPSAEKVEYASRIRDSFVRNVQERGQRLPERWRIV